MRFDLQVLAGAGMTEKEFNSRYGELFFKDYKLKTGGQSARGTSKNSEVNPGRRGDFWAW